MPSEGDWKDTALGASFSTFYSDRYLTTLHLNKLHDVLSALSWFMNSATALLVWQMSIIMTINITNCPGNRPFPGQFSAFIHFVRKIGLFPDESPSSNYLLPEGLDHDSTCNRQDCSRYV